MDKRESNRKVWSQRVEQWQASGLTAQGWCREHELNYHSFLYWKNKSVKARFIELTAESQAALEIQCEDIRLFIKTDFDELTLLRCLKAIRASRC